MRVTIVGSGGVGGYYGGMLARASEDVTFIARGAHLDAMRANGLTVKTAHVGAFTIPVIATDDPNDIGPVDLVLFCVKTYDTTTAAELIRPLIGRETVILPLQNGVESPERIGRIVGQEHVIGGTTYVSSKIEAPGVIREIWDHKAYLGELDGQVRPRTERLLSTFKRAEVAVEIPPDIQVAMWGKLLSVSAFTAVCCVTRLPGAVISVYPETSALFWGAMEEGLAVARARGVAMPDSFMDQMRVVAAGIDPMMRPSMYYDLEAGKRLELEDMIGVVVRLGEQYSVPTRLTFAMYAALKPYADGVSDIPERWTNGKRSVAGKHALASTRLDAG
jgi:2-dehydropantoate 2-reductase